MANKKTQTANKPKETVVEAPVENKLPEDVTLATGITPSADMKMAAAKETVELANEAAPKIADCVAEGDEPPRKLKKGETYLGSGSIMVSS